MSLLWFTAAGSEYRIHHGDDDSWEPWTEEEEAEGPPKMTWAEHRATGESVGHSRYREHSDRASLMGDVYVDPEHRGRGVGKALVRRIHEETGKKVDPVDFTPDGVHLWRSLGWDGFGR